MHGLISLYYCPKKKNSRLTDSLVSGQRTLRIDAVIQYNDNCFLANGQWAGHNERCITRDTEVCESIVIIRKHIAIVCRD